MPFSQSPLPPDPESQHPARSRLGGFLLRLAQVLLRSSPLGGPAHRAPDRVLAVRSVPRELLRVRRTSKTLSDEARVRLQFSRRACGTAALGCAWRKKEAQSR